MLEAFLEVASKVEYHDPQFDFYSTLTGRKVSNEVTTASYWQRHVRAPVQFWPAMSSLHQDGYRVFLEIGPHSTLLGLGRQCLPLGYGTWLPSLRRDRPDWLQLMETLAELYVGGIDPDWTEFDREFERRPVVVPTYPFQRERHWIRQPGASSAASVIAPARGESALGHRTDSARDDVIYESLIALRDLPFLDDHRMGGRIVAPAPLFLERAMAAGEDALEEREVEVLDLELLAPMIMGADEDRVLQVVVRSREDVRARVEIFSRSSTEAPSRVAWTQHASCSVAGVGAADAEFAADEGTEPAAQSLTSVRDRCKDEVAGEVFYERLAQRGVEFGPRFQGIRRVLRGSGEALAEIEAPDGLRDGIDALGFHPAVLDACLQAFGACVPDPPPGQLYLMSALERYRLVRRPPVDLLSHARLRPANPSDPTALLADIRVLTRSGEVVALVEGMAVRAAAALSEAGPHPSPARDWLHVIRWEESTARTRADVAGPAEISEALAPTVEALEGRFRLDDYRDLVRHLEACCVEYVGAAFRQLGWTHDVGQAAVSAEALARTWGVPEKLHGLLERLLQVLAEDGVLAAADGGWSVRGELPSGPSPDTVQEISRRFPDFTGEVTLLDRCGRHLADVLRGEQDPLSLLFPGGSTTDVEKLTRESPAAQAYNTLVRDAFAAAVAGRRPGDKLRVLEMGGGTGGTTTSILPLLSEDDCAEYVFTDVSPLFVEAARESLDEYGFVAFDLLDIERDPAEQGFADRRFDVIIAANVLHATRDLRESLANVRKLLAPGGLLVLLEGTAKRRWVDLTFGLTDGWWRFADRDLRPDHPLLSSERWLDLLEEEGFDESVALSESGVPSNDSHAVVLARKRAEPGNAPAGDRGGRWLILADAGGAGRGLAEHAEGLGYSCVLATPGQRFESVRNGEFTVDPFDPESLDALLRACEQEDGRPPLGVAHLLSLDAPDGRTDSPLDVDVEVSRGCRTALLLTQAIIRRWPDRPPRLWLVTRGAQPAGSEQTLVSPAQAALWGFGRTVAGEHPELWGGLVDLDPSGGEADEHLLQELFAADGEDQVALRGDRRLVARLHRVEPSGAEAREQPVVGADGTYLVTGATGGVGLHLTRWLADQGARHLALVARREPGEEAERVFEGLREQGVQVSFFRGDVAREAELAQILSTIDDTMPALRGVYHLALVLDEAVVSRLTWDRFERVLEPKVRGTWNLHALTRDLALDVFAIFSSGASFLGSTGLANYAAASAFQDALAVHRRALGLPAVSIDWGAWVGTGGAAVGPEREAQWRRSGFDTMPVEAALQALEMILLGGLAHVAVLAVDWRSYAASLGARTVPPLYEHVLAAARSCARERRPTAGRRDRSGGEPSLDRATLLQLTDEDRLHGLEAFLRSEAAAELGMLATDLDPARSLNDMGFDSLMAVQLKNRLLSSVGVSAPVSLFVEGRSVQELARAVEGLLEDGSTAPLQADPLSNPEELLANLDGLSDQQIDSLLADAVSDKENES
jgi:acyl transferase domain-containing protein